MSLLETVLDDISTGSCIPLSECPCKHDKVYKSNEVYQERGENWYVSHFMFFKKYYFQFISVCFFLKVFVFSVHALQVNGLVRAFKCMLHVQLNRVHT